MNETSKAIHDLTKLIGHYHIQEVKLSTKSCDYYLTHLLAITAEVAALKERLAAVEQIARLAPELNLNNYDHDEVRELNDAMIQLYDIVRENEEQ
jgi:hypothetical protein